MQKQIKSFIKDMKSNKKLSSFDEASTKQAVVLRMLSFLGWDIFNVDEVCPDYGTNSSQVSYALRIGTSKKIFVEVKKISEKLDSHQKKFVELAAGEGADIAVLTNGVIWWFYLASSNESWQQKWIYSADFFEQEPDSFIPQLADLLTMNKVSKGQALKTAKNLFREKKQKMAADFLPKAWNQIISQPNKIFIELLSLQTEKLCGYKVDIKSIETFLGQHVDEWILTDIPDTVTAPPSPDDEPETFDSEDTLPSKASADTHKDENARKFESYSEKSIKSFTFIGHSHIVRAWDEVLPILCDYLASTHEKEFEKVLWISDNQKPYFSRYSDQLRIPEKIQETDIYVETRMIPDEVAKTAIKLIEAFGYSPDDLSIDAR
jgi:predicted type IV restriction endonuclease